jgi:hypothetical protein
MKIIKIKLNKYPPMLPTTARALETRITMPPKQTKLIISN